MTTQPEHPLARWRKELVDLVQRDRIHHRKNPAETIEEWLSTLPPDPDPVAAERELVDAALPFAAHDWMDAELEDDNCKLTKHSGKITVGDWRRLREAIAPFIRARGTKRER